jgi:quinol monooxygenase YgiN
VAAPGHPGPVQPTEPATAGTDAPVDGYEAIAEARSVGIRLRASGARRGFSVRKNPREGKVVTIMVLLELKAKADAVESLKAALPPLFPETRAFDGCRDITAYTCADDGRTLVFVERWESRAHYERYLAWRTETGTLAEVVGMLEGDISIRYFEQVDA